MLITGREIFEMRWNCLQELRNKGHVELEDYMGWGETLYPLRSANLLRQQDMDSEWQRYNKLVPTKEGERYLLHVPEVDLIVVRKNQVQALTTVLEPHMPAPGLSVSAGELEERLRRVDKVSDESPDEWVRSRCAELRRWLLKGYMDLDHFRELYAVSEEQLVQNWGCERGAQGRNGAVQLIPIMNGLTFLRRVPEWELVMVRPGMVEDLRDLCTPQARSISLRTGTFGSA